MEFPIIFHITKEQAKEIAKKFNKDLKEVDENLISEMLDMIIDRQ